MENDDELTPMKNFGGKAVLFMPFLFRAAACAESSKSSSFA